MIKLTYPLTRYNEPDELLKVELETSMETAGFGSCWNKGTTGETGFLLWKGDYQHFKKLYDLLEYLKEEQVTWEEVIG